MEQRRMDYHLHTLHSMDGRQTVDELCASMAAKGVQEICLTEHIEPGHPDASLDIPPIWDVYFAEIAAMKQKYPQLTIRAGVEIGDNPLLREQMDHRKGAVRRVLPADRSHLRSSRFHLSVRVRKTAGP